MSVCNCVIAMLAPIVLLYALVVPGRTGARANAQGEVVSVGHCTALLGWRGQVGGGGGPGGASCGEAQGVVENGRLLGQGIVKAAPTHHRTPGRGRSRCG